jgi:hypothetical protein
MNIYRNWKKIFRYCATNKLSINLEKANFMVITNSNKRVRNYSYGLKTLLKKKYLGIYIDNNLNWEYQIKHVNSKIAKNTGIMNKLRYYIDLKMLKHLYYWHTMIYPHTLIMDWWVGETPMQQSLYI